MPGPDLPSYLIYLIRLTAGDPDGVTNDTSGAEEPPRVRNHKFS
jgi:hypothetical protein